MKLGGVPYEATAARFADWLDGHNARGIHRALPWWTAVADTLSIIRAIDLLRARAASDTGDARVWTAWRWLGVIPPPPYDSSSSFQSSAAGIASGIC